MTLIRLTAAAVLAAVSSITFPASAGGPVRAFISLETSCKDGYVWREAGPGDQVCVTPEKRAAARRENAAAASLVDPSGASGPQSCIAGFVWRSAFAGDYVCVKPARRDDVARENALGPSNRA
jgi:hypothetical protein